MDVSRVLRQLYVGSCPTSVEDIDRLKADYRITAILNLQTDDDFDHCNLDWNSLEARYHELGDRTAVDSASGFRWAKFAENALRMCGSVGRTATGRSYRLPSLQSGYCAFAHRRRGLPCSGTRLGFGRCY